MLTIPETFSIVPKRKLTAKSVGASKGVIVDLLKANENKPTHLYRIAGTARKVELKPSEDKGESYTINGDFKMMVSDELRDQLGDKIEGDGIYSGGTLYLPKTAEEAVVNACANFDEAGKIVSFNEVQVAFDVSALYNETSSTGYEYSVVPLIEFNKKDDPAMGLLALPMKGADKKKSKK